MGGAETRKFQPIPQIGGFRSKKEDRESRMFNW